MTEITHLSAPPSEVYWREYKPLSTTTKMLLLTVGGVSVIGCWYGEYGEAFIGWSPLPRRIKRENMGT